MNRLYIYILAVAVVAIAAVFVYNAAATGQAGGAFPAGACTDSDAGITPDIYGYVSFQGETMHDTCIDSTTLREYYCSNGELSIQIVNCNSACENSACLQ